MKFIPLAHHNAAMVVLPSQVIMSQTATLRMAIIRQLESGSHRLVMDLSQVEYIDSSGLSILISVLKKAKQLGGDVVLLSPTPGVRALIELTRLHQIFTLFENREAACEYICSPASAKAS
ncbi:STAS domain-containing protein [Shewanella alkalitolerans]|uniref:STAS domain-containing protein n=1 Tax=Shewanella alkalitolerans TaxID=2864209 RepID=UPI001C6587ED|nr:STAS domain-containing protein [Shewanella alkalitolerans]QYJ98979.1 STAS domain-containing protein [Shewanella alkalitolerans]